MSARLHGKIIMTVSMGLFMTYLAVPSRVIFTAASHVISTAATLVIPTAATAVIFTAASRRQPLHIMKVFIIDLFVPGLLSLLATMQVRNLVCARLQGIIVKIVSMGLLTICLTSKLRLFQLPFQSSNHRCDFDCCQP